MLQVSWRVIKLSQTFHKKQETGSFLETLQRHSSDAIWPQLTVQTGHELNHRSMREGMSNFMMVQFHFFADTFLQSE